MRCVFGIDVSKSTMNIAIIVERTTIKETKLIMNKEGFNTLSGLLGSFNNPEVVFEATGVYSRRLERFLSSEKVNYVCLNPLVAKKQLDNLRPNKTDKNDALGLASTQFIIHRLFSYQESPVYRKLADYSNSYQEVSKDLATHRNRLHRALQLVFPEIEDVLSNTKNDLYYFLVENFCQPKYVLTYSNSIYKLAELIKKGTRKQISIQRATKVAEKLISAAKNVYSAVDDDSPVFEQIDYIISKIQAESDEKKIVISKMVNLAQSLKEFDELLSIPGLGKTTVVQLIGELGDIRRFRNSNALNAFIGIDLRHYESGNYVANDHISKRGNTVARKILFKSVQSIAVVSHYHPSHINDFYQRKKKQSSERGTKKIAIATMHRLIRTMYHLVKFDQTYDYSLATR